MYRRQPEPRGREASVPARNGSVNGGRLAEESLELQLKAELNRKKREEENAKLTQMINDYRMENEKCTKRIQELKEKLINQKQRFRKNF
mmetsp:Transcript_42406/g.31055  ORF Transcript_42406/g.31055 Transcript_42406/m.31055 type:complete len:89 (+) Transcript_42406:470-736(+)|eukprot:CAMPEP_0202965246 /NCGR_PEP_ID=MMETSP1396-20130829/9287_1 /ASSEMBLY_ACC=CAM_ASM_000872 /TAXON_ID= /ORGANISM="Pseudokeronopsis sp., Strain Brazil" /LENGTH=88 /DNA_ID=CAMNT_0049687901 /DNA_START=2465 /DNA_END=2731 /DNA_ORIENTATION=+